jgi:aldose 1-epimerase
MWRAIPYSLPQEVGVRMYYLSRHMEEGYPGNLSVEANLKLDNENQLTIEYRANTDTATICNITSHPYFNLDGSETILNHKLWIDADKITTIDNSLLTTGELLIVNQTPFDFTVPVKIGAQLGQISSSVSNNGWNRS